MNLSRQITFFLTLIGLAVLVACTPEPIIEYVPVTVVVTAVPDAEVATVEELVVSTPVGGVITIVVDERRDLWTAVQPDEYTNLEPTDLLEDEETSALGRVLYLGKGCVLCHGQDGNGQGAFSEGLKPKPIDFTDAALMGRLSNDYLYWRMSEGGLEAPFLSAMPAWKHILTESERWQLVAYLRSLIPTEELAEAEPTDSEQLGYQVLLMNGCLGCHMYDDQGSVFGPPLDEVGLRADIDFIRESVLDPSAVVADGYPDLMPKDFEERISEEDLDILVDFLVNSTGD